jgi:glycosyltransferase involved in cell wall biosynthesis
MSEGRQYFIATSWSDSAVSHHFRVLAATLARRGHRVVLLVDGQRRDVERHDDNPAIYTWPSRRPVHARDARFLRDLIRAHRPDCLIANFGATNVMTAVGWLMSVPCRVVWYRTLSTQIEADTALPSWRLRLLQRRKRLVYRAATHLVANSEAAAADARRVYGVPEGKRTVFYNGLADPFNRPEVGEPPRREHALVCPGRLYHTKGQDVLIRAIGLLLQSWPDLSVDFVGEGPAKARYMTLARDLGVVSSCTFSGKVRHDDVLAKMAAAAVTVVPSRSEAFGWVNIESLAVRTPVVASRVGGITEIVRDGMDGFLVPPDDPPALADRVHLLLSRPDLAEAMRSNARGRFLERFEQRKVVTEQVRWLEEITADRGQSRA